MVDFVINTTYLILPYVGISEKKIINLRPLWTLEHKTTPIK